MEILDGKKISNEVKNELKDEVDELVKAGKRVPGLAVVLVGEDPASEVYVNYKEKDCKSVGFYSEKHVLPINTSQSVLLELIEELNTNEKLDGILVQLPLPKHIDSEKVLEAIKPEKDVDGFHPINVGKLVIGNKSGFLPCTPYGIIEILKRYEIEITGKEVVVIGRSNIVGKPVGLLMLRENATVTIVHSKTKNIENVVKKADIIIAAVGRANFVKENMVKEDAVIIDVGINREGKKLLGDVDFENVSQKSSYITPVPGGVGPMTRAMLLKNTFISYKTKM